MSKTLAYSREQAAKALGISTRLLDNLARQHRAGGIGIPNMKLGGRVVFPVSMLNEYLEEQSKRKRR